jgi:hypothetical protein
VKVQSQYVRVILFRESLHTNHRSGSSGLNLTCEGLLLGMRVEGYREFHDEAPPRAMTFALFVIINIPSFVSQERTSFVEEP